jgi:hypothetical protein
MKVEANPKLGGETPVRTNMGEKTRLTPFSSFLPQCALFASRLLIPSPVLAKLGPSTPSLVYFTDKDAYTAL